MTDRWVESPEGMAALYLHVATAMQDLATVARDRSRERILATEGSRGTSGWPGKKRTDKYAKTIRSTTYIDRDAVFGSRVETGEPHQGIHSIVYSASYLAHMLELGTDPHDIQEPWGIIHHPGGGRRPHFWFGLALAAAHADTIFAQAKRDPRLGTVYPAIDVVPEPGVSTQ